MDSYNKDNDYDNENIIKCRDSFVSQSQQNLTSNVMEMPKFVPMNDFYNGGENVETPETPLLFNDNNSYTNRYKI